MTKTDLLTIGRGRNHIADFHFFHGDHDAINEQVYQLPFLLKSGLLESADFIGTKHSLSSY